MVFALGAGKLFSLDNGGEFEETIIGMRLALKFVKSDLAHMMHLFSQMRRHIHYAIRLPTAYRGRPARQPEYRVPHLR